jgi:hypothetical protein
MGDLGRCSLPLEGGGCGGGDASIASRRSGREAV